MINKVLISGYKRMCVKLSILLSLTFAVFLIGSASYSFAQITNSVNVEENKLVTLIGEGYDADEEELVFKWVQIGGEPVTLSSYNIPQPTFMAPKVINGEIKVLTFELTVTDPIGASNSDIIEIVVNPVNHVPFVDAGNDLLALPTINAMSIIPTVSDADDDFLSYSWKQLSGQDADLDYTTQKHLTILPMYLDFSDLEPMVFEITVNDGFGGIASDTVNVFPFTGLLDNKRISVSAGPLQTVTEGDTVTLRATGQTLDGKPISYSWVQLIGVPATLSAFNGQEVQFVAPAVGGTEKLLSFQVTGYSPGNGWANALALVKVIPSNGAPIANAGADQTVFGNTLVKLEGTGTDPDGEKLKYSWAQKSGPSMTVYERASFSVYFTTPHVSATQELVFELTVTDPNGNYDTDEVTITITNVNSPPRAFAGSDKRVIGGSQVEIIGNGVDPDGDPLTYQWKQIFGEFVEFDATSPSFTFTAPKVLPTDSKRLEFQLTVTDPSGKSGIDNVVIFAVPENGAPTANAGTDQTVDENALVNIMCSGSDPDNDAITFSWESSDVQVVPSNNAIATFMAPSVVSDTKLTLTCTVSDGRYFSSDSMIVTVVNTLNLDIVADAGEDRIVNENVKVSLDGSASYDPEEQNLSYRWTQVSGETVTLSSATTTTPSFTSPVVANGEIKVLTFELKVYDDNGRSAVDTVTVTVDPVNSSPEATASARQ